MNFGMPSANCAATGLCVSPGVAGLLGDLDATSRFENALRAALACCPWESSGDLGDGSVAVKSAGGLGAGAGAGGTRGAGVDPGPL